MPYNPAVHHRRSIRLAGYDYSRCGAYFITACAHNRAALFGEIIDGEMRLNDYGQIVEAAWLDLVHHVPGIELGEFGIMPNHVHGIIMIVGDNGGAGFVRAGSQPAPIDDPAHADPVDTIGAGWEPARTEAAPADHPAAPVDPADMAQIPLSEIVRQFKTFSARRINEKRGTRGVPVWQRNDWEHIIRSEPDYQRIAGYILENPQRWHADQLHPEQP